MRRRRLPRSTRIASCRRGVMVRPHRAKGWKDSFAGLDCQAPRPEGGDDLPDGAWRSIGQRERIGSRPASSPWNLGELAGIKVKPTKNTSR
jgi:hypothetical protein